MSQSIPLQMQLDEARRLKDTLEDRWQHDHNEAMHACNWTFIVAKCLQLAEGPELGWQITCGEAVTSEIGDLKERSQSLQYVFDLTIEVTREAHDKARAFARATGHTIERLDELESVMQELERKRNKYLFRLSLIDDAVIQEAQAEHAAGSYRSAAAALADLLAARQAEQSTPPYAELRRWADRSPPPPSWLDENDDTL